MRFVDFFCGIGGFRLGLERAGHSCVYSCEIEAFPRAVYAARFGKEPESSDITTLEAGEIPDADLWCGGFPCQDLSTAGKRSGIDGERSGLVWKFLDLARERKPDWLLLENVPGLLSGGHGVLEPDEEAVGEAAGDATWFGALLGALVDLGYVGASRVLDAQFFGVPQRRRRVFILARRAGAAGPSPEQILLEREGLRGRAAKVRGKGPRVARSVTTRAGSVSQRDGDGDLFAVERTLGSGYGQSNDGPLVASNVAPTLLAPESSRKIKDGKRQDGGRTDKIPIVVASTVQSHHGRNAPDDQLVASALTASAGHHGRSSPRGDGSDNLVAATLTSGGHPNSNAPGRRNEDDVNLVPFDMAQVTSAANRSRCEPGSPAPTLARESRPHVAYALRTNQTGSNGANVSEDASPCLGSGDQPPAVMAFATRGRDGGSDMEVSSGAAFALRASPGGSVSSGVFDPTPAVCLPLRLSLARGQANGASGGEALFPQASGVRRLMPVECERLQSFPDGWTDIPGASDSRRYKALGNSVAVVVIEWIGRRLPG